jgi:hypothetical protein
MPPSLNEPEQNQTLNLVPSQLNPFNSLKIFLSYPFKCYSPIYAFVFHVISPCVF